MLWVFIPNFNREISSLRDETDTFSIWNCPQQFERTHFQSEIVSGSPSEHIFNLEMCPEVPPMTVFATDCLRHEHRPRSMISAVQKIDATGVAHAEFRCSQKHTRCLGVAADQFELKFDGWSIFSFPIYNRGTPSPALRAPSPPLRGRGTGRGGLPSRSKSRVNGQRNGVAFIIYTLEALSKLGFVERFQLIM